MFRGCGGGEKSIREQPNSVVLEKCVRNTSLQKRECSRRFLECSLFCDKRFQTQKPVRRKACPIFALWKEKEGTFGTSSPLCDTLYVSPHLFVCLTTPCLIPERPCGGGFGFILTTILRDIPISQMKKISPRGAWQLARDYLDRRDIWLDSKQWLFQQPPASKQTPLHVCQRSCNSVKNTRL